LCANREKGHVRNKEKLAKQPSQKCSPIREEEKKSNKEKGGSHVVPARDPYKMAENSAAHKRRKGNSQQVGGSADARPAAPNTDGKKKTIQEQHHHGLVVGKKSRGMALLSKGESLSEMVSVSRKPGVSKVLRFFRMKRGKKRDHLADGKGEGAAQGEALFVPPDHRDGKCSPVKKKS